MIAAPSSTACVHPQIARVHFGPRPVLARGRFSVRRGPSRSARLIAALLRLPPAGHDIPVTLTVRRRGACDEWTRAFGSATFRTNQLAAVWPPVERFGPLELTYEADAGAGWLKLASARARLRFGPLAIPLPAWLAPRDRARVEGACGGFTVDVRIELPAVGMLVEYAGVIEEVE